MRFERDIQYLHHRLGAIREYVENISVFHSTLLYLGRQTSSPDSKVPRWLPPFLSTDSIHGVSVVVTSP